MVLSNPQTPYLSTFCLISGPSGPQLYGPPYLFSCNSTTAEMASSAIIGLMLLMLYGCNATGESEASPPFGGA